MPARRRILSRTAFDCALRGPFDHLGFIRLSAARTLCGIIMTFISASTVCVFAIISIAPNADFVNSFFKKIRPEIGAEEKIIRSSGKFRFQLPLQ